MSSEKKRFSIDLFAGCGGLSLGLEEAGFFPILVNELNHDAMETYLINRDDINPLLRSKYHVYDVKELVLKKKYLEELIANIKIDYGVDINRGDLDLLVGGPPCQGFSGIGHRRSYSVDKEQLPSNMLYQDMAYLINKLKPRIFLFENVRGLLNAKWTSGGKKGEIWEDVKDAFRSIPDYDTKWDLVYAKDFGVPQNRPRVILIGIRKDIGFNVGQEDSATLSGLLPKPTKDYPDLIELLGDLIDKNYKNGGSTKKYLTDPKNALQESLRLNLHRNVRLKKGDELTEQDYSKHSDIVISKFKYMLEHDGKIPKKYKTKKFAQRVLPAKWGSSGPSITATSLSDDYVHFSQPRVLTVREWARLQMFPDWYQFAGKRTTGGIRRAGNPRIGLHDRELPKYTQIGNAVPVGMAKAIGVNLKSILDSCNA